MTAYDDEQEQEAWRKLQSQQMRNFDEGVTIIVDNYPRIWHRLFRNLITEGFNDSQAMSLVKCFIMKDCLYGVHIHKD